MNKFVLAFTPISYFYLVLLCSPIGLDLKRTYQPQISLAAAVT